ncbi:hypothetical protein AB0G32_37065 [Streptomyces sp. NPDC023723]|uniref:hypothetical protein n=1 Tax=Streptomyces sp. NPDC023723 TaxID=3154323 RepID=UPI0033F3FCE8
MTQGWKITVLVLGAAGIVSTPLVWLLNGPDGGEAVGASIQAAVGAAALVWALFQPPEGRTEDQAAGTGEARATGGGTAVSGIRRRMGRGGGSARAGNTGSATADGTGSRAVSGIEYTS